MYIASVRAGPANGHIRGRQVIRSFVLEIRRRYFDTRLFFQDKIPLRGCKEDEQDVGAIQNFSRKEDSFMTPRKAKSFCCSEQNFFECASRRFLKKNVPKTPKIGLRRELFVRHRYAPIEQTIGRTPVFEVMCLNPDISCLFPTI